MNIELICPYIDKKTNVRCKNLKSIRKNEIKTFCPEHNKKVYSSKYYKQRSHENYLNSLSVETIHTKIEKHKTKIEELKSLLNLRLNNNNIC